MVDIDFQQKVALGRTGLAVSRLGIGSSYGVSERACLAAHERGVNYFFWGSARTRSMARAIRRIARTDRDRLVVVMQSYVRFPGLVGRSVENGLRILGLDYADIVLLGWHDSPPSPRLLDAAERLRSAGRFRHLGISSHVRPLFRTLLAADRYDLFHIRYNAAHRGAEQDIFPYLPKEDAPGIVSFTNTRWGSLLRSENMPPGEAPLTAADCYRFALSNPHVQVAISGPKDDGEMAHALTALDRGPLDADELARVRNIGDHVHGLRSLMSYLS